MSASILQARGDNPAPDGRSNSAGPEIFIIMIEVSSELCSNGIDGRMRWETLGSHFLRFMICSDAQPHSWYILVVSFFLFLSLCIKKAESYDVCAKDLSDQLNSRSRFIALNQKCSHALLREPRFPCTALNCDRNFSYKLVFEDTLSTTENNIFKGKIFNFTTFFEFFLI